jgi:hypothetical protein
VIYAATPTLGPISRALAVLTPFSLGYLGLTLGFGLPEAQALLGRLRRR